MNWFIYALKNSFNFKDRARRKEYGWFILCSALINATLGFIQGASEGLNQQGISATFGIILSIFQLLMFIPNISVTTRRLHDLGYSGWWQLLPLLLIVMIFCVVLFGSFQQPGQTNGLILIGIFSLIVGIIYLIFELWLIFKDGQPHANKYGESPKYPSDKQNDSSSNNLTPPSHLVV